jgi:Uma2 family endonuclease
MSTATRTTTADELFMMPHDGFRYELVKGELIKVSPTGGKHGILTLRLGAALIQHIEANNLGEAFGAETGFILSRNPDTVRAPDVAFVSRERIPPGDFPEKFWPGAPDLAVEVLSPSDTLYEVEEAHYYNLSTEHRTSDSDGDRHARRARGRPRLSVQPRASLQYESLTAKEAFVSS